MVSQKALWDTINEGGDGYRPDYAKQAPRRPVSRETYLADGTPRSKVEARLAKDLSRLPNIADMSARVITEAAIAAARKLLEG